MTAEPWGLRPSRTALVWADLPERAKDGVTFCAGQMIGG